MNKNILKYFGLAALLALGANAEAATIGVTAQDGLEEAIKSANAGDTIKLAAGTFSTYGTDCAKGKTLTFEGTTDGDGNLLTMWNYGSVNIVNGEHGSDYSFEGSVVNFTNVKFHDNCNNGNAGYRGFVRLGGGSFTGCTFDTLLVYLGDGTVTFKECVFNMPEYCFWAYGIRSLNFDTCTFNSTAGKFINAYIEGSQAFDIGLNIKDCTFNGGAVKYPAVKIKKDNNYIVAFTGTQTFNNVGKGSTTDSQYFDIESGIKPGTTVTIGGSTVWANGAPVEQPFAVAKIGTKEYETVSDALKDAAAAAGETEVKLLCDSSESSTVPAIKLNGDIKVTAESATTVVIAPTANSAEAFDTDGMAYVESADAEAVRKLTVGENVTFRLPESATYKGAAYLGYNTPAELDVYGNLDLYLLYVAPSSLVTIRPSGSVKVGSEDIIIRRYANVLVDGTDADWSAEKPQAKFGYVDIQGGALVLSNTFVNAGAWINMYNRNNLTDDKPTLALFGTQLDSGSNLTLKDAACEVWLDAASCITTKGVANSGSINIDATGAAEPVKVIDFTGKIAMTLADYGTVNVTGGEAYVEDNDLWVKAKVEVVPEKPTAEEVKEATKVVDESGEVVEPTPEQQTAAKTEVEKVAQSFDNPEIAKVETHVAAAAMTVTGEGEEQKVVVKSAIVEELQKAAPAGTTDQITSESDVTSYVKVALGEAKVAVKDDGAALKSVTFDVKPMAETTVAVGAEKTVVVAQIPNGEITEPITFRLPLTDAFTVSAIVTHEGDPDRLCMVQGEAGARYVEMSATHFSFFTVTPSEIIETTTESKTVLGIKRVDYTVTQSTADLAAAVPWLMAAEENMPVSGLITTGLREGDQIQVYEKSANAYYTWLYRDCEWEEATGTPSADEYSLERGRAFWYKPVGGKDSSGTYTQVGLYSEAAISSKVEKVAVASASFANPVHFLMASPKYEDFNLKEKLTADAGCRANDVVVIVATGARYRFNGMVWGQDIDKEVTKFGVTVTQKVFEATEGAISVPAGTAFWYLSAGGAPEFEW